MATNRLCVIVALAALTVSAAPSNEVNDAAKKALWACHNITGTCLSHGYVCANEEVVPHGKRCDGVEDCSDGTDEFMCGGELTSPLHERSDEQRHAFAQATCVHCNCAANTLVISQGSSWYDFALKSPVDYYGLGTGEPSAFGGQQCNPKCTQSIKVTFYRKNNVCRGYLCCVRQNECKSCFSGAACRDPNPFKPVWARRCYAS